MLEKWRGCWKKIKERCVCQLNCWSWTKHYTVRWASTWLIHASVSVLQYFCTGKYKPSGKTWCWWRWGEAKPCDSRELSDAIWPAAQDCSNITWVNSLVMNGRTSDGEERLHLPCLPPKTWTCLRVEAGWEPTVLPHTGTGYQVSHIYEITNFPVSISSDSSFLCICWVFLPQVLVFLRKTFPFSEEPFCKVEKESVAVIFSSPFGRKGMKCLYSSSTLILWCWPCCRRE